MSRLCRCGAVAAVALAAGGGLAGGVAAAPVPAAPVPAGFEPVSFSAPGSSALGTSDWWVGGTIPCRSRHRCIALVRTTSGGRSFVRVPLPALVAVGANGDAPVMFADARDGYIYGTRFWVTHDGGRRWQSVHLGGGVGDVATGDGFVYALVSNYPRGFLMRSPVGHDDWTVLAEAPDGFEGVTVEHGTVMLDKSVTLGGEQQILISHDQGADFTASRPLTEVICAPQDATVRVIWMLCSGGMTDLLFRSTDGGLRFSQPDWDGNPADTPTLAGLGHASLGAADATTAVLGSQQLLRTTDGGKSFRRVPVPLAAAWTYVGFFDREHGVALGRFGQGDHWLGRLYYTSNGGRSYRLIPIRSP